MIITILDIQGGANDLDELIFQGYEVVGSSIRESSVCESTPLTLTRFSSNPRRWDVMEMVFKR